MCVSHFSWLDLADELLCSKPLNPGAGVQKLCSPGPLLLTGPLRSACSWARRTATPVLWKSLSEGRGAAHESLRRPLDARQLQVLRRGARCLPDSATCSGSLCWTLAFRQMRWLYPMACSGCSLCCCCCCTELGAGQPSLGGTTSCNACWSPPPAPLLARAHQSYVLPFPLPLLYSTYLCACPCPCTGPPTPSSLADIKKEFDKKYGPTWHVVVGRNFGSYVTHETKHFIYFYLGQVAILCFKSG